MKPDPCADISSKGNGPAQREVLGYNLEAEEFTATKPEPRMANSHWCLSTRTADVIVLDLDAAQCLGIEVCGRLKMRPRRATCRSSCCRPARKRSTRCASWKPGRTNYVVKPYSVSELMARVRSQLAAGAALRRGSIADATRIIVLGRRDASG